MGQINNLADEIYEDAKKKGWYDKEESENQYIERMCNNLHDEVSELHEAWRNGLLRVDCDKTDKMTAMGLPAITSLEEELADIIIRALDNSKRLGVNIERAIEIKLKFNKSRPYRHGNKLS